MYSRSGGCGGITNGVSEALYMAILSLEPARSSALRITHTEISGGIIPTIETSNVFNTLPRACGCSGFWLYAVIYIGKVD
ncbi:hypothetical protein LAY41_01300 [Argonema galeatum A003/A1]|nr:hypothetical protein [Argonema galeatum A003/A1]